MNENHKKLIVDLKEYVSKSTLPPDYDPKKWDEITCNCYQYALNLCIKLHYDGYIAPGFLSRGENNDYKCMEEDTIKYFREDCEVLGLNVSETTLDEKIEKDEYKIGIYIDYGEDFHFIRQDSSGKWSEKHGWFNCVNIVGEKITDKLYGYNNLGFFKVTKKG